MRYVLPLMAILAFIMVLIALFTALGDDTPPGQSPGTILQTSFSPNIEVK